MKTVDQKLDQVKKLYSAVAMADASAQSVAARCGADELKLHPGLSTEARAAALAAIRKPATTTIAGLARSIEENVAVAVRLQPRFESTELLLSGMTFSDDPATDATIRQQRLAEYQAMPSRALQEVAAAAIADNDLASLWIAFVAGQQRHGEPGWKGVDLSGVVVPQAVAALALIGKMKATADAVRTLYAVVAGSAPKGVAASAAKLAAERARRALQPAPTTRPSSHGRPPIAS
jgi:hypothetical protein